jgi:phosphatidylinositol alpha-1,6-mannosyltransferase
MPRTLVVTNDYPPRPGGIQAFVQAMVDGFTPSDVVVYASTWRGRAEECRRYDAERPYLTVRDRTTMMVPDPKRVNRAVEIARAEGCDRVWFGAAAPLALMAPALRRRGGVERLVATTHGHEAGWAPLPVARQLLRRIGDGVDVLTYLVEFYHRKVGEVLSEPARARMAQLHPGVDVKTFHPGVRTEPETLELRTRLGLADRPTVVCVSRLVPRKGQDTLIRAMPLIKKAIPDAALLIGSGGPYRGELEKLAAQTGVAKDVVFSGPVSWAELPRLYAAGDVFAMPCRTRRGGLDIEGLGIVYLEASALGMAVVGGDSGGAPDAVLEGETGYVVPGAGERSVPETARRVVELLSDPAKADRMGKSGRDWVEREWQWPLVQQRFRELLEL